MSNDAARSFLESIAGYTDDPQGDPPSHDRPVKLGIVDLAYSGTGEPRVKFDGESLMGARTYVALLPVAAGDRVVMLPVGRTYVVLGSVAGLELAFSDINGDVANSQLATEVVVSRLRVTSTSDASASSTAHGFQVGDTDGLNIIIDNNEIIFRNNGAVVGYAVTTHSGAASDSGWVVFGTGGSALQTGWATFSNSTFPTGRVRRVGKVVSIVGAVSRSSGAGNKMANLPSQFRPDYPARIMIERSGALTFGLAEPDGMLDAGTWASGVATIAGTWLVP